MKREEQLGQLIDELKQLVSLLEADSACHWAEKFRADLAAADAVASKPFNQQDYANLSSSIRSAYGGMGSFNDYVPGRYSPDDGRYVLFPWADQLDRLSTSVFERALALVTVDRK